MADKEYIAGDPADVRNIVKELESVNLMMRKNTQQSKLLDSIYTHLNESIKGMKDHEKGLYYTNLQIETTVNHLKILEDARNKGLTTMGDLTQKITDATYDLNILLNEQRFYQEAISKTAAKAQKTQKMNEALFQGMNGVVKEIGTGVKDVVSKMGIWGSLIAIVYNIGVKFLEIFDALDTAAMNFRKEMGFTRTYTGEIDANARATAVEFAKLGVTGKDVYESVQGLSKELFTSMNASPALVKDMSILSAQLGISAEMSAQLYKNLGIVGGTTALAQKSTVMFAAALSEAAGTPLKDVMEDINTATKNSYQFVSRSATAMVKAAVDARRMGTSIESATKTSSSLLNFTQNVKDEMEASVLVGKSINLQKARELAYHRDIQGLNKEILNIAKQTNFEQLDPFQQEAVAKALGKTSGEMMQMVQADKEERNLKKAMTAEQRKQYETYQKMLNGDEKAKKNYAEIAEKQLKTMANQTRMKNISNSWNAIMMKLAEKFLPMIDNVLKFIADHFDTIFTIGVTVYSVFKLWRVAIDVTVKSFRFLWEALGTTFRIGNRIGTLFERIFGGTGRFIANLAARISPSLGGIATRIGTIATKVFKILAPLMFAWNIFKEIKKILNDKALMGTQGFFAFNGKLILRAIGAIVRALWTTINDLFFGLPYLIVRGLKSMGNAILGSLLDPFRKAWHWLGKVFLGKSPSTLGLMILDGIASVGDLIVKALVSPFKRAWELVKSLPIVGRLFGKKNVGGDVIPEAQAAMTVDKPKSQLDTKRAGVMADVAGMGDELGKKFDAVVAAINALRDDMKAGTLTANVYIDSQKLDALMGRRLAYTGQLT